MATIESKTTTFFNMKIFNEVVSKIITGSLFLPESKWMHILHDIYIPGWNEARVSLVLKRKSNVQDRYYESFELGDAVHNPFHYACKFAHHESALLDDYNLSFRAMRRVRMCCRMLLSSDSTYSCHKVFRNRFSLATGPLCCYSDSHSWLSYRR